MLAVRSAKGVALGFLAILIANFAIWTAYGLTKHTAVIVIPNVVGLATTGAALATGVALRAGASGRLSHPPWKIKLK